MSREKKIVWAVFIVATLLWALDVAFRYNSTAWTVWAWRREAILLTGILAIIPMGVVMILSLRPRFLEPLFHGLDKMYYAHKWLGIFSIVFVALHYGVKLGKSLLTPFFPKEGSVAKNNFVPLDFLRGDAKTTGEVLFYAFVAMLVITLFKRIPYRTWKPIHRLISLMFIASVFHTVVLMPARYWLEPIGLVTLLLCAVGLYAAVIALTGNIGKRRQFRARITRLEFQQDVTLATCQIEGQWHHRAGQYAFIRHQNTREAHPFTIASHDNGSHEVRFAIKALGHYTRRIQSEWKVGDSVRIEGPYGQFFFDETSLKKHIWIAGGVGITPFIAWLESLSERPVEQAITLYYCVNQANECLVPDYLKRLCDQHGVTFHMHCSSTDGYLKPNDLALDADTAVFFCGPANFAAAIEQEIRQHGLSPSKHFHREFFDMR